MTRVQVLLATYNGEKFLGDLIKSVMEQSYSDFTLVVRDDCSTDETLSIIKCAAKRYPTKIAILEDELGNLGSSGCFYELLKFASSDFIMFCDQDDVWYPNKIFSSVSMSQSVNSKSPLLVFTDLEVVDEGLKTRHESMLKLQKMDAKYLSAKHLRLLAQNPVAGCTTLINREGVDLLLSFGPFPSGLVYDHWVSSIISYYGKVIFYDEPTIKYRQHGSNQVGASSVGIAYFAGKLFGFYKTCLHDVYFIQSLAPKIRTPILRYIVTKIMLNLKRIVILSNRTRI